MTACTFKIENSQKPHLLQITFQIINFVVNTFYKLIHWIKWVNLTGVPPEALKGYNYYDPVIESSINPKSQSIDFINETGSLNNVFTIFLENIRLKWVWMSHMKVEINITKENFVLVIRITTCGHLGRMGPTSEQCANEYNGTNIEVLTPSSSSATSNGETSNFNLEGIQRWTAPRGGYYT